MIFMNKEELLAEGIAFINFIFTEKISSSIESENEPASNDLNPYEYGSKDYEYREKEIEDAYRPK